MKDSPDIGGFSDGISWIYDRWSCRVSGRSAIHIREATTDDFMSRGDTHTCKARPEVCAGIVVKLLEISGLLSSSDST